MSLSIFSSLQSEKQAEDSCGAIENVQTVPADVNEQTEPSNQIQEKQAQIVYLKPVTKSKRNTQEQTIYNSPYETPRSSLELNEAFLETKLGALNVSSKIFLTFIWIGMISTLVLFLWAVAVLIFCLALCSGYFSSDDLFGS